MFVCFHRRGKKIFVRKVAIKYFYKKGLYAYQVLNNPEKIATNSLRKYIEFYDRKMRDSNETS